MSLLAQSTMERALDALRAWLVAGTWAASLAAVESYATTNGAPALVTTLPDTTGIYIGAEPPEAESPLLGRSVAVVLRARASEPLQQARDGQPTGRERHEVLLTLQVHPEGGTPERAERRRWRLLAALYHAIATSPQLDQAGVGAGYLHSIRWRSVEHHAIQASAIYLASTVTLDLYTQTQVT